MAGPDQTLEAGYVREGLKIFRGGAVRFWAEGQEENSILRERETQKIAGDVVDTGADQQYQKMQRGT